MLCYQRVLAQGKESYEASLVRVKEMFERGDDLTFNNVIIKLNDPVSLVRIRTPVKGRACKHMQVAQR